MSRASALPVRFGRYAVPAVADFAKTLGVSEEAVRITRDAELIDLHVDTFIPPRLWGYDPLKRHRAALAGRWWFGHLDVPRMFEGGLDAAMWSITTNPFRPPDMRLRTFHKNLARFRKMVHDSDGALELVRNFAEYEAARARGAHAVLLSVQGGNAFEASPEGIGCVPDDLVVRATVVHLTNSAFGATNSPLHKVRRDKGLTAKGADFVRSCNQHRVFVDLAHIHEVAFWDAVSVADPEQPLLATHAGVDGGKRHWRNLDDKQIEAIATSGGTIGIIFAAAFLQVPGGPVDSGMIVDHMQHIVDRVGDDHVSVGSDYDGMIVPPWDLASGEAYARLVQKMMDRGWDEERIGKVLGGNALRCLKHLRPGPRLELPAPA
jgi:membrane dipeptidase